MIYYAVIRTKFDMLEDTIKAKEMLQECNSFGEMVRSHK